MFTIILALYFLLKWGNKSLFLAPKINLLFNIDLDHLFTSEFAAKIQTRHQQNHVTKKILKYDKVYCQVFIDTSK